MNKPPTALADHLIRAKLDLLDVEWIAIVLAILIVCATACVLEAVI